jgi:hypothetical protein
MSVLLSTEVNAENVIINEPKTGRTSGFKSAKIRYSLEGKESRFFLQTGKKMRIPFGISNNEKFGDGTKWETQFSFQDEERSPSVQNFHEALDKVNTKVLQTVQENSQEYLGKEYSLEMLMEFFKNSIKQAKDPKYAPTFRVQVPFKGDKPLFTVYNEKEEEMEWSQVEKGSNCTAVVEATQVWMSSGTKQFGITWRLLQMQVFKSEQIKGFQIRKETQDIEDESDDDDDEEESDED